MDYLTPLLTNFRDDPDFNQSDFDAEFEAMLVRNRAIELMLTGEISVDDLLDVLESQEVDPLEYATAASASIETTINQGMVITGCPSLMS